MSAILGIRAPDRQGAKTPEYLGIPSFRTSNRTGCIGVQWMTLFLSEPLASDGKKYLSWLKKT